MADRAGFEPAETLLPHTLSKRAHLTTLPPVLKCPVGCGRTLASNAADSKLFLQGPGDKAASPTSPQLQELHHCDSLQDG